MVRRRRLLLTYPPVLAEALGIMSVLTQLGFRPTTLTIAGGTITRTRAHHRVDTEGAAATDDLTRIDGRRSGIDDLLMLAAVHTDRTVVVKHGQGNINLAGGADFALDTTAQRILLIYDQESDTWNEVSRSASAGPAGPTGPAGTPGADGIPGYGVALPFNDAKAGSASVSGEGDYKLALAADLSSGVTSWAEAKNATQIRYHQHDQTNTDHSGYLDSIRAGDVLVIRAAHNRWLAYRFTADPTHTGALYTAAISLISYREDGGTGTLAGASVELLFSRGTGEAGQRGPVGYDGQPGYGAVLRYNTLRTGSDAVNANGHFKLASSTAPGTGISAWDAVKDAASLQLFTTDAGGTDQNDYLAALAVGDLITLRLAHNRWIAYRLTADPSITASVATLALTRASFNEAGGVGALTSTATDFLPSVAPSGADGATGPAGPPGLPGYNRVTTYNDIYFGPNTASQVAGAGDYALARPDSQTWGRNLWSNHKIATRLYLNEEEADGTHLGAFFGSLEAGSLVVFRLRLNTWIAYELTAAPVEQANGIWQFQIMYLAHDESGGQGTANGVVEDGNVDFLFARNEALAIGAFNAALYARALAPR